MSISDMHQDLLKNLENALDVGKIVNVFNSLICVIKDQQAKIEEQDIKLIEQGNKFEKQQNELLLQINYLNELSKKTIEISPRYNDPLKTITNDDIEVSSAIVEQISLKLVKQQEIMDIKLQELNNKIETSILELVGAKDADRSILTRGNDSNMLDWLKLQETPTSNSTNIIDDDDDDDNNLRDGHNNKYYNPDDSENLLLEGNIDHQSDNVITPTENDIQTIDHNNNESKSLSPSIEDIITTINEEEEELLRRDSSKSTPTLQQQVLEIEVVQEPAIETYIIEQLNEEIVDQNIVVRNNYSNNENSLQPRDKIDLDIEAQAREDKIHIYNNNIIDYTNDDSNNHNSTTPTAKSPVVVFPIGFIPVLSQPITMPLPSTIYNSNNELQTSTNNTIASNILSSDKKIININTIKVLANTSALKDLLRTTSTIINNSDNSNGTTIGGASSSMNEWSSLIALHPSAQKINDAKNFYQVEQALAEYNNQKNTLIRRKMNVNNLKILPTWKRHRLVKRLKRRGMLLQLSKSLLTASKETYSNQSLKQKVDYLESEAKNMLSSIKHNKKLMKQHHKQLRSLLPLDFHIYYDHFVSYLTLMEQRGGFVELKAMPLASNIIAYDENENLSDRFINKMKKYILPEVLKLTNELDEKIKLVTKQSLSHIDMSNMLTIHSTILEDSNNNRSSTQQQDVNNNQSKLISLIFKCIEKSKAFDAELSLASMNSKSLQQQQNSSFLLTAMDSNNLSGNSFLIDNNNMKDNQVGSEDFIQDAKYYTDKRCKELKDEVITLQKKLNTKTDVTDSLLHKLKTKVGQLEKTSQQLVEQELELKELRKKDNEALRIVQKRIASASIETILDELKVMQTQVNDRPSTNDVSNMMDGITHTFKKHLGENVMGLRSLVDDVYTHIQQKVNREDIKKLISAKLHQMELDILRKEQEMFTQASSTRCLSCGQLPPDPGHAFTHTYVGRSNTTTSSNNNRNISSTVNSNKQYSNNNLSSSSSLASKGGNSMSTNSIISADIHTNNNKTTTNDNDLLTVTSNQSATSHTTTALAEELSHIASHKIALQNQASIPMGFNHIRSEDVYSLLTGSAGLKPLMQQHSPMTPVKDPYGYSPQQQYQQAQNKMKNPNDKIPDPRYRKAKMASQMKEMIKISSKSAQNYGFHPNNPFYVHDGFSVEYYDNSDNMSQSSLASTDSLQNKYKRNGSNKRPSTTAATNNTAAKNDSSIYIAVPTNPILLNSKTTTTQLLYSNNTTMNHLPATSIQSTSHIMQLPVITSPK